MNVLPFFKMSASGNDFIIINNIKLKVDQAEMPGFVRKVCQRRISVGADGLIFVEKSEFSNFRWIFLNSDGSLVNICGNGAMCVAKYAYLNGIAGKNMVFETNLGIINANISDDFVKVKMPDPKDIKPFYRINLRNESLFLSSANTGVPHVVIFINNIGSVDVINIGRSICHHRIFQPECVNVNFVEVLSNYTVFVRTYERGVEDETLACGTGSIAVAIMCAIHYRIPSPISLRNFSGSNIKVYFKKDGNSFKDIYLKGDVRVVYTGMIWKDGWEYSQ